jgi:hypothetical protein
MPFIKICRRFREAYSPDPDLALDAGIEIADFRNGLVNRNRDVGDLRTAIFIGATEIGIRMERTCGRDRD